ncbi:hypothetical protein QA597_11830 [Marinilabiliaceae bacterium ANBcel2]|nr:hypothetical protein [Marinilabiliaceae bacterium ANBcel2]
MRINYPNNSKFLQPCEEMIQMNHDALAAGLPVTVSLSSGGYPGTISVNIDENIKHSFYTSWNNPDPTRFPQRIKVAAWALFQNGFFGEYIISHESGNLTICKEIPSKKIEGLNMHHEDKYCGQGRTISKEPIGSQNSKNENIHHIQTDSEAILERLLKFNSTIKPAALVPALCEHAAQLIANDPFAFALAAVIDRGAKAEIIWTIPYYLKNEIGSLDPRFFSKKTAKEIETILFKLTHKPRYISDASRTIQELSIMVLQKYNGDTSKIWKNKNSEEIKAAFLSLHGVGPGITSMILLLLERFYGFHFNELNHKAMDLKPDVHIIRVMSRLGLISHYSADAALIAARKLNPVFPGAIDAPLWIIGRNWCFPNKPICSACPANDVCPQYKLSLNVNINKEEKGMFNLIVTCVGSKKNKGSSIRDAKEKLISNGVQNDVTSLFREWKEILERHIEEDNVSKAVDLYKGGMWNASLEAFDAIKDQKQLWIISCGYGFINSEESISGYHATFGRNKEDSLYDKNIFSAIPNLKVKRQWWNHLTTSGIIKTEKPRSIHELVNNSKPSDVVLIAAGADYYEAIYDDLNQIDVSKKLPKLAFVGIKKYNNGYVPAMPEKLIPFIQFYHDGNALRESLGCNKIQVQPRSALLLINHFMKTGELSYAFS